VGHRQRGLGNGVGCTASRAQQGRRCCMLENDVAGLGTRVAWSTASVARVGEDGGT
jgi:hypothetical protein